MDPEEIRNINYTIALYPIYLSAILCCTFPRYSAVRRQFGPSPEAEIPVIEYQLQVSVFIRGAQ